MEVMQHIFLAGFVCVGFIPTTVAVLCSYETSNGLRHKYCTEKCCDIRYDNVCCYYKQENEIYIGSSIATLTAVAIFLLCFTYICCNKKPSRLSRDSNLRHSNSRHSPRENHILPTVSEQVQSPGPPPYEVLPPPYNIVEQDSNFNKHPSSLPDEPPPAYFPDVRI